MSAATPRRHWPTVLLIVAFAAIAALASRAVNEHTAARIAENRQAWEMRHLREILDPSLHDNDMANDYVFVRDPALLGGDSERAVYRAFKGGEPVGAVIATVAPNGYSGPIQLLVGVLADGRVAGVRITAHRETPGLGDRVDLDQSNWLRSFDGHALDDPIPDGWRVRRDGGDFDQFTGATVTPRAVVSAVRDALLYFAAHRDDIFAAPRSESSH